MRATALQQQGKTPDPGLAAASRGHAATALARAMPPHPPPEHADEAYDAFAHAMGRHHASDGHYVLHRDAFHASHAIIEVRHLTIIIVVFVVVNIIIITIVRVWYY